MVCRLSLARKLLHGQRELLRAWSNLFELLRANRCRIEAERCNDRRLCLGTDQGKPNPPATTSPKNHRVVTAAKPIKIANTLRMSAKGASKLAEEKLLFFDRRQRQAVIPTPKQLADRVGIPPGQVRHLVQSGRLQHVRIGARRFVPRIAGRRAESRSLHSVAAPPPSRGFRERPGLDSIGIFRLLSTKNSGRQSLAARLFLPQKLRQPSNIDRDPSCLVFGKQFCG
jgi:hypothetical protein